MSSPRCQKYSFEQRKQRFLDSESLHSGKADKQSTQHLSQREHKVFLHVPSMAKEPTRLGWPVTAPCLSLIWEDSMSGFGSSRVRGSTSRTASSLGTQAGLLARVPSCGPLGTTGSECSRVRWKFYDLL